MSDQTAYIKRVRQGLNEVRQVEKCKGCECLLDVMAAVQQDLGDIKTPEAAAARAELESWLAEGKEQWHPCLGCEVCLPIAPYNQFSAALRGDQEAGTMAKAAAVSPCGCAGACGTATTPTDTAEKWPIVEGDYWVGCPDAAVAICTLADRDLPLELQEAGLGDQVAIVGTLATENLGIERVIRNVVTNPRIRFLILCGRDSRGHRAGQALLAFAANGIDTSRRIIGAAGPRPVLKNAGDEEVAAFRHNVTVIDEIGTRDIVRLTGVVESCLAQPTDAVPRLPPKIHKPKTVEAQPNREWMPDPEGFFFILLDREPGIIVCEHYTQEGVLNEVIRGTAAEDIAFTAVKRGLVSRLDHAAYLGRELAKAETALNLELPYTQDKLLPKI